MLHVDALLAGESAGVVDEEDAAAEEAGEGDGPDKKPGRSCMRILRTRISLLVLSENLNEITSKSSSFSRGVLKRKEKYSFRSKISVINLN